MVNDFADQLVALGAPQFQDEYSIYTLGIQFSGRTGGVVPQGPGGVHSVDTTRTSRVQANSTLTQQGFDSTVTCSYSDTTPLTLSGNSSAQESFVLISGTCPGTNISASWHVPNSNQIVASMNCSAPTSSSNLVNEVIYIAQFGNAPDDQMVQFLTCQVGSSVVMGQVYHNGSTNALSWNAEDGFEAQTPAYDLAGQAVIAATSIIREAQMWSQGNQESSLVNSGNLVVDAINSLYIPYVQNKSSPDNTTLLDYPMMFAAMLRGIMEYEVFSAF